MTTTTSSQLFPGLAPASRRWLFLGLGLILGYLALVIWLQYYYWSSFDDYAFGYLAPVFALYVLYERKEAILEAWQGQGESPAAPSTGRLDKLLLIPILCGMSLLAFSVLRQGVEGPNSLSSVAGSFGFSVSALSLLYLISGLSPSLRSEGFEKRWQWTSLFLFPVLVWLVSSPMEYGMQRELKLFLLNIVTQVVYTVFEVFGATLRQEGNVLILPNGTVGVEDACSGIRSLTGCLFAGSFLAAVFLDSFKRKLGLVLVAAFLAFITNIFRGLFLTAWVYQHGDGALDMEVPILGGTVHDVAGFAVLGLTLLGLFLLLPLFQLKAEPPEEQSVKS